MAAVLLAVARFASGRYRPEPLDYPVWIPQLRRRPAPGGQKTFKLPATLALCPSPGGSLACVPHVPAPLTPRPGRRSYQQIRYREAGSVGYLEFCFPGGAMSTGQCRRLLAAYRAAELAIMRRNFTGPGEPYPGLRRAFVCKEKPRRTPPHLARHREHALAT